MNCLSLLFHQQGKRDKQVSTTNSCLRDRATELEESPKATPQEVKTTELCVRQEEKHYQLLPQRHWNSPRGCFLHTLSSFHKYFICHIPCCSQEPLDHEERFSGELRKEKRAGKVHCASATAFVLLWIQAHIFGVS